MSPSRVLLLGKDGQVGTSLQPRLAALGELFAHGRSTCDLAKPDQLQAVIRNIRPDLIINAAAYTAVDDAESDEETCYRINAIAPGIIAKEAKSIGAWLVHYSTDYVFDGSKTLAYLEDETPSPLNVYGHSKLEGDRAISAAMQDYTIFRVSWVYGPTGRNFAKTIMRLAAERDELRVVNDQFGAPTSSHLIADVTAQFAGRHLADASSEAVKNFRGVFNLAPSGRVSWHGFAVELVREAGRQGKPLRLSESAILPIPSDEYRTPALRPKNSLLDTGKIRRIFGLEIPSWQSPLKQFVTQLDSSTT